MKLKSTLFVTTLAAFAFPAAAWAGAGTPGHHHAAPGAELPFGKPGDPKMSARIVKVAMTEGNGSMAFSPAVVPVKKGERIHFVIENQGELDHEFMLATLQMNLAHAEEMKKNPDMEHDDPNAKRVASKTSADVYWVFTKTGEFDFSCLIPGHREAGMHGKIVVK